MKTKIIVVYPCDAPFYCHTTFMGTEAALGKEEIVYTTQLHFLNFKYAERLFVSIGDELHEITLGNCVGTNMEIREGHNLEKMLLAGVFDWF